MHGVGLKEYIAPIWIVDGASVQYQVEVIAKAETLEDVLTAGLNPSHYKQLRATDARSFLGVVAEARNTITDPVKDLEAGGRLLRRFYGYLIFRASNEARIAFSACRPANRSMIEIPTMVGGPSGWPLCESAHSDDM